MFAWSKEDVLNMKLPEEWTKGVFEISVEDPMSSLMVIWVCGEAARSADSLSDHQIKKDIAELLKKFTGRNDVSEPDHLYRNCWSQDKFSFGSYSASSLKMSKETFKKTSEPLPSETNPKLLFAGEGTHLKFWSFLHGARESGLREANRILQKINE